MSEFSKIINVIYETFEPIVGRENIHVRRYENKEISVVIYSQSLPNSPKCLFLDFIIYETENKIFINELGNCKQRRMGPYLLNLIENMAKRIGISKISLIDESKIEFGYGMYVSLNALYNLTTGQSWYNKLGYICKDKDFPNYHENEFKENLKKINTTSVINFVLEEVEPIMGEPMGELLKDIEIQFPELNPNKTIQEYFTNAKYILQQYSDGTLDKNKNIVSLATLINKIDESKVITTYSTFHCKLVKELKTEGGKRIRKKGKKTKSKTKKVKNLRRTRKNQKKHR